MIGKKVRIKKDKSFEGDVTIIDKVMTNMALYSKSAIINNAPFEVYIGLFEDLESLDVDSPIIDFKYNDIIKIY